MPRTERVITIFVASPSDLKDERIRLEQVISELNVTWSKHFALRVELVQWETHAYPSFGTDAQAVINQQIPTDYDVFIGMMWCRFGTPTNRAGSGTEEEFKRAKEKYDNDPGKLKADVVFQECTVISKGN